MFDPPINFEAILPIVDFSNLTCQVLSQFI